MCTIMKLLNNSRGILKCLKSAEKKDICFNKLPSAGIVDRLFLLSVFCWLFGSKEPVGVGGQCVSVSYVG
jgi:hypothetical protein